MSDLLSKHLSVFALRNVLSLHVLVDYFGAKKLHQITGGTTLTSTMFQASGSAPGTSGYVNITDLKAGKVAFGTEDGELNSHFVKSVSEVPYNISVLQISQILNSAEAEAPTAQPNMNLTATLYKQGCTAFADLAIASGAIKSFEETVDGGLTVFCPSDKVISAFAPKYKNLTKDGKVALLLFHGIPVYQSMQMLKTNNGVMNTLATDGANKYDFTVQNEGEDVKLETKVVTATITGTLKDEEPLIVYKIDKVLQPRELFKVTKATTKAAPAPKAESPSSSDDGEDADAPTDESDNATADDNTNAAVTVNGGRLLVTVFACLCLGSFLLL